MCYGIIVLKCHNALFGAVVSFPLAMFAASRGKIERKEAELMTESVILREPALTLLLATALLMQVLFRRKGWRGAVAELVPALLCVLTLLAAVLLGGELAEVSLVLCSFFALSLASRGGKKQ